MVAVVPELGAGGWVEDPLKTLDLVIAHAFETDYSQSSIYPDKVTSISYILTKYNHDPASLAEGIQTALAKLLNRYFDSVNVVTSIVSNNENNTQNLNMDVTVKRNGITHSLNTVFNINNGRFNRVLVEINK